MMNLSAPTFACTDRMGRIILSGMEEILGCQEITSVFNQAPLAKFDGSGLPRQQELDLTFERLPQLQASLEIKYGLSAGRGLAIRSGRACFRHLLREFGNEMGLTNLEFRLLSLPARLKVSNQALAALLNRQPGMHMEFEMDEQYLHWTIASNPETGERHIWRSTCHLVMVCFRKCSPGPAGVKYFRWKKHIVLSGGSIL